VIGYLGNMTASNGNTVARISEAAHALAAKRHSHYSAIWITTSTNPLYTSKKIACIYTYIAIYSCLHMCYTVHEVDALNPDNCDKVSVLV